METQQDKIVAFMPIDEAIRDICSYLGDDKAEKYYIKVARTLKHVLYEFNIHLSTAVKSVPLVVESNMTARTPNDLVSIAKVGLCCSNGKIKFIGRNDNLCIPEQEPHFKCCDCEKTEQDDSTHSENCCPACTFHNIEFTPTFPWLAGVQEPRYFYGYTPKMFADTGYYRHDVENGQLIFSGGCEVKPGGTVIVEYASALSVEGYQLIPRLWYFTLQHKVAHQIAKSEFDWRQFKIHYDMVKRALHTYTLEDIVSALRGTYKSSPKR